MKRYLVATTMLAMVSLPAFAAKNSQTVSVPSAIKAGSAQLAPGNYEVTWTGSAPDVQVTVTQNHKVIVTLPAKLVVETNKNEGLETDSQGGVDTLHAIRMRNSTLLLESSPSSEK
jgi:uncharacterized protein with FMN-binding domain